MPEGSGIPSHRHHTEFSAIAEEDQKLRHSLAWQQSLSTVAQIVQTNLHSPGRVKLFPAIAATLLKWQLQAVPLLGQKRHWTGQVDDSHRSAAAPRNRQGLLSSFSWSRWAREQMLVWDSLGDGFSTVPVL